VHEPRDVLSGQDREVAGLVEDYAAGEEGGNPDIRADEVRVIPGADIEDHTQGFVRHLLHHPTVLNRAHDLILHELLGLVKEEVDAIGDGCDLVQRLRDRLSHLKREIPGELLLLDLKEISETAQNSPTILESVVVLPMSLEVAGPEVLLLHGRNVVHAYEFDPLIRRWVHHADALLILELP